MKNNNDRPSRKRPRLQPYGLPKFARSTISRHRTKFVWLLIAIVVVLVFFSFVPF